jgi:hypothetical protein
MQPPGDFLFDSNPKDMTRREWAILALIVVGAVGALKLRDCSWTDTERLAAGIKSKCGDEKATAEELGELERLPPATGRDQVKALDEAIIFLKERCRNVNTGGAVKRMEKVKARWEAALPKDKPVGDLEWRPKPQGRLPARAPQKLARSRC